MDWREKSDCHFNNSAAWVWKMNSAVDYIENNLCGNMDYREAARQAYCSLYHFQRIFSFIANCSLAEYIRERRLTLAAFEIRSSDAKIIDIALKYSYNSPEAFSRAFKKFHGISPSQARLGGAFLKSCPRITFRAFVKGGIKMEYCIKQREAFSVFGVETEISTANQNDLVEVPAFWKKCRENGEIDRIRAAAAISDDTPVHAIIYRCTDTQYTYMLGYLKPQTFAEKQFVEQTIPKGTWAVFTTEELEQQAAAQKAAELWKQIFTEWFSTSGYELVDAPELELHFLKESGKYLTEIWIPVIPKE